MARHAWRHSKPSNAATAIWLIDSRRSEQRSRRSNEGRERGVRAALGCAPVNALGSGLRGEAVGGLLLAVVAVEDREEFRDGQEVLKPLRQAHQLDLGAVVLGCHRRCDEGAEAGAVDV